MALQAGTAYLDLQARLDRKFNQQVESAGTQASSRFGSRFSAGLSVAGKAAGVALAAGLGAAAVGAGASIKAASDLNETVNKTSVVFGKSAADITAW